MAPDDGRLCVGRLSAVIADGDLRRLAFGGHEVLRRLSYPVRDGNWGTWITGTTQATLGETSYERHFRSGDGVFEGAFQVAIPDEDEMTASVEIRFLADTTVNRAGFTLLHPIAGVAGSALRIRHPDGSAEDTTFPRLVRPDQPARDIAGMRHRVGPVDVDIALEGDIFEMEDQRNWSDASYKTYCRPLSLPRPYAVRAGEVVRQSVRLRLSAATAAGTARSASSRTKVRLPQVLLAHEAGISPADALSGFPGLPVLARLSGAETEHELARLAGHDDTSLEIVFDDLTGLDHSIARIRAAGLRPRNVVALPASYLRSYQPEGPWPHGAQPRDAIAPLRRAFPGARIGGGSLTNFTELNRCRPDPAEVDFITFGNTAIVHAADDRSVWETLEAIPHIIESAEAIAGGKPLRLGLISIGMRSNPYGAGVTPNAGGLRVPMAMDDPRQATGFAAAYATAALAIAAARGVEALALAMPDGPLGAARRPIGDVLRMAASLAGAEVEVIQDGSLFVIRARGGGLAANCAGEPAPFAEAPDGVIPPESAVVWGGAT